MTTLTSSESGHAAHRGRAARLSRRVRRAKRARHVTAALAGLACAVCVACSGSAAPHSSDGGAAFNSEGVLTGGTVPSGPPAAVVPHAAAVQLPGTAVTYYEDPAAPTVLSSYAAESGGYLRQPDGTYKAVHDGHGTMSPGGRWSATVVTGPGLTGRSELIVTSTLTGRSQTLATPDFQVWSNSVITWSATGSRLFVTAVSPDGDQNIGYAYGDAPAFQLHLVPVSGDGYADTGSNFFFAQPTGTGAIFNLVTGPRNMPASGPLEFISLNGSRIAQFPAATIPVPVSTPFSPDGKLMLVLCADGQCVLNAHTGAVVGSYRYVGYDGQPEYPAQNAGWYDDQHFLNWIGVGPGHYALAVVNLSGLVTGILAIDRSKDIPQVYFSPRHAG